MKKHYYLGLNAKLRHGWRHLLTRGRQSDVTALSSYLGQKYGGKAILTKNGRSALAIALKTYFTRGDGIIVNGFTCYAVIEAVRAAGLVPIYADINRETLNYDAETLNKLWAGPAAASSPTPAGAGVPQAASPAHAGSTQATPTHAGSTQATPIISGIIVQNTLGNPVDIKAVERFAGKHGLVIIEDLAHCAGIKYADGREAGTIGAASVLSFGKDKSIDTISGGAVVLRYPCKTTIRAPKKLPKMSDRIRGRIYPLIAGAVRGLSYVHLGGLCMRVALKLHLVEKSADNKLELDRTLTPAEAKLALRQLKALNTSGEAPLREFYLVDDRALVLDELKRAGYHFAGFWYETPIAPERYYKKADFDESKCPVAAEVARQIINFPTYYTRSDLAEARRIVQKHLTYGGKNAR